MKREIRSCRFLIWVKIKSYIKVDFHEFAIGPSTGVVQDLISGFSNKRFIVALFGEADVREGLVEVVLGLLIKGVNELGVSSLSSEVADDVEEDSCEAQEFKSVGLEFFDGKEGTRAKVLAGLGLGGGLWFGEFGFGSCGVLLRDFGLGIDFLKVVFFDVLGVKGEEGEEEEKYKSFHQLW